MKKKKKRIYVNDGGLLCYKNDHDITMIIITMFMCQYTTEDVLGKNLPQRKKCF